MNARVAARGALLASLAAAAAWVAACNAITGLDKYTTGGGTCGTTRYVSTSGDDSHDGCTPQTARKTIKAAVGDVVTIGQSGYTIEVCAGSYAETDLAVSFPMSLRGGYDCQGWQQTATHDYPGLDRANETIITNASPDSTHIATLTLGPSPAGASGGPVVDGFTVQGADGLDTSYAVRFLAGSTGTLSNCRVDGGDATTQTIGVGVASNGAEVTGDLVHGGKAVTSGGVVVNLGSGPIPGPKVHDITVVTGTATQAASGVVLTGSGVEMTEAAGAPFTRSFISAGGGSPAIGLGIYNGASADAIGNVIQAGTQSMTADGGAASPGVTGVSVSQATPGAVRLVGNRIYAGGLVVAAFGDFDGVSVVKTNGAVVANNMIYGGYNGPGAPKGAGNAHPVHIIGSNDVVVVDNTLYTGLPGGGFDATSVRTSVGVTGTVLRDNILAGIGGLDWGITMDDCSQMQFAAVEHNLFVGQGLGAARSAGCSSGGETAVRDLTKIGTLLGAAPIDGNVTMRGTCADGGSNGVCFVAPACPTPIAEGGSTACMEGVFAGWTTFDNGYTTLLDAGWTLTSADPCAVTRGALPLDDASPPVNLDFYGNARGSMPSMGAAQYDGGCE